MAYLPKTQPRRPWRRPVLALLMLVLVAGGISLVVSLGKSFLRWKTLSVQYVVLTGSSASHQEALQRITEKYSLGQPLFWFDDGLLLESLYAQSWVKEVTLSKDPPNRLLVHIVEKEPLLWVATREGVFLVGDGGFKIEEVSLQSIDRSLPVISNVALHTQPMLSKLAKIARTLKEEQEDFFNIITEMDYAGGPVVYLENFNAPIKLAEEAPARNIPNFQAIYTSELPTPIEREGVQAVNLRISNKVILTMKNSGTGSQVIDGTSLRRKQ